MPVSGALQRLLRIRDLEEEQSRLALESALGELHRLQSALEAAQDRDRRGRKLVKASAGSGELPDRLAGLEEIRTAQRHATSLEPRIADAENDVTALREEFLAKRVERRQAETVIQETEALDALEDERRGQRALDDWYRARLYREGANGEPGKQSSSETANPGPGFWKDEGSASGT
jgi:flagellar export protein FliJ